MKSATIHSDAVIGFVVKFFVDGKVTSVAEFTNFSQAFAFAWQWRIS